MAELILVRYSGSTPSSDVLRQHLGLSPGSGYTYIVTTAALERLRRPLAEPNQTQLTPATGIVPKPGEYPKVHLMFAKAIRYMMPHKVLTRAEERILLQRAAAKVAAGDKIEEQVLRRDVFEWRDALANLAEQGIDLTAGITPKFASRLVNAKVGALLRRLQVEYAVLKNGGVTFEEAARSFIRDELKPSKVVVLEGFTFFTPLQRHFIDRCLADAERIYMVIPYRTEQARGFAALDTTYANLPITRRVWLPEEAAVVPQRLDYLQRSLYAGAPVGPVPADDNSVVISTFRHRNHEIAECIRLIKEYVESRATEPNPCGDIAVVMRNPQEFLPALREEADVQGLRARFKGPPRLLLLTPLGRFALALYKVWKNGALELDSRTFEAMITSGWLGALAQASKDDFSAVREQMFTHCVTRQDWQDAFAALRRHKNLLPPDSRLPANEVDENSIRQWERALARVETICCELFSGPARTIGGHIQRLLDELNRLDPELMLKMEQEVLERIQEVLIPLAEANSVEMAATEFGDVLNSLVQERKQADDDDGPGDKPDEIWVTTPEGIDSYAKPVVFYLGVDSDRVPRQYQEPWPLYDLGLAEHMEKERYLFLAVVRAARRRLYLSCSLVDGQQELRPAVALTQSAELLGITPQAKVVLPTAAATGPEPEPQPLLGARRSQYDLADIAHYALCPFRYKMEGLSEGARRYRERFQLQLAAQAVWLDTVLNRMAESGQEFTDNASFRNALLQAMADTEAEVKGFFPALRPLEWRDSSKYVANDLLAIAGDHGTPQYPATVVVAPPHDGYVLTSDVAVQVNANARYAVKKGQIHVIITADRLREEWLLPSLPNADLAPQYGDKDGARVFGSLYHAAAFWRKAMKAAFDYHSLAPWDKFADEKRQRYGEYRDEIAGWVHALEQGAFPKNKGEHCRVCPVRYECMGV